MALQSIPQKQCTKCFQWLPATLEFFYCNAQAHDGLKTYCKDCRRNHRRIKEKVVKPYRPRINAASGFKYCPDCLKEYPKTEEYFYFDNRRKTFHSICRECTRAARSLWRKQNSEQYRAIQRKSCANHPDSVKIRNKRGKARRRSVELNAEGTFTQADLRRIFDEQEGRCAYCGLTLSWQVRSDIHADHIIPLSRGGTNWPDNIALSCQVCNLSKGDKLYEEWRAIRGW